MGYTIKVNPADLQDREAFLAFLHEQAERGYQVVRVLPTHTYFKKAPPESVRYSLTFDGEGADSSGNLYALNSGVVIRPASDRPEDPGWCEKVLASYSRFTRFRRSRLWGEILRIVPTLILLVPCVYLLDLFGTAPQSTEFTDMIRAAMAVLGGIGIFQAVQLAIHLLSWRVDQLHLKGMRRAASLGRPYRTPEKLAAMVRLKNGLSCYGYGVTAGLEAVYLLLLLLGAAWWRIQTEAFMFGFAKMPPPGTCSVRRWSLPARPRIWRRWHWRTERPEQTTRRPEAKRGSLPQNCLRRRSYPRGARSGRPAASRYWPRRNWVSTACLPAWKLPSSSARGPTASTCPD